MALSGLHLLFILMAGLSLAHWTENPEKKTFCSWKCLLYVLQWPGSFCVNFTPSECSVPSNISDWTIHGLWRKEWIKHGVCAACVEGMNSPQQYFQIALKLREHYNLQGSLDTAGIKPSCNQTYKYDQIYGVLAPVLGDHVVIQCMQDDKGQELLVQVKILISRNLTLGCKPHQDPHPQSHPPQFHINSPGHPCPKNASLFYLPINPNQPHSPCG